MNHKIIKLLLSIGLVGILVVLTQSSLALSPVLITDVATVGTAQALLYGTPDIPSSKTITTIGFNYGLTKEYTETISGDYRVAPYYNFTVPESNLSGPLGVTSDSDGNLYVANHLSINVRKFSQSGTFIKEFIMPSASIDVATDSLNNLYVLAQNGVLYKFNQAGETLGSTSASSGVFGGVAVDSSDNIYVTYTNYRVRKLDSSFNELAIIGNGYGAADGQFKELGNIATDSSDNLYVVDRNNSRVQKFDGATGAHMMTVGSYGTGDGQFNKPWGIAVDSEGNIYVSEDNGGFNFRIQRFDPNGEFVTKWGANGGTPITFPFDDKFWSAPLLTIDASDDLWITDYGHSALRKYKNPIGQFSLLVNDLSCGTQYHYQSYATNLDGTSYGTDKTFTTLDCVPIAPVPPTVSSVSSGSITNTGATLSGSIDFDGGSPITTRGFEYGETINYGATAFESGSYNLPYSFVSDFGVSGDGKLSYPYDIHSSSSGDIFVLMGTGTIKIFDSTGTYKSQFSVVGNSYGFGFDSTEKIYVATPTNGHKVVKYDSSGAYIGEWESGEDNSLMQAYDVAVDSLDNIYVVDVNGGGRIQKFDSNGLPIGIFYSSNFSSGLRQATFDSHDVLYITDINTHKVHKMDTQGNYLGNFSTISYPEGIAIDFAGNLHITSSGTPGKIVKYNSQGEHITTTGFAWKLGEVFQLSEFRSLYKGVTIDGDNNIVVTDAQAGNSRARILSQTPENYSIPLSSLTCNTEYHYRSFSVNEGGTGVGEDMTFTTTGENCVVEEIAPPVSSGGSGNVSSFFPVPFCEFDNNEYTINRGEQANLQWKVLFEPGWENFPFVLRLQNPFMLLANSITDFTVSPDETTTYDLNISNKWGFRECKTTVVVKDPEAPKNNAQEENQITQGQGNTNTNTSNLLSDESQNTTDTEPLVATETQATEESVTQETITQESTPPINVMAEQTPTGLSPAPYCPYFTGYIHYLNPKSGENNPDEILKVKKFLNEYQDAGLNENRIMTLKLHREIKKFQQVYAGEVLSPWTLEASNPTGYWYQSTKNKANWLKGCDEGEVRLDNGVVID
ncbi:MAG: hypothetical protein OEX08_03305 [Candidatus Nomurabacteria bacterium]|nr:hypothetical protein [Candidatus Nomurabacteria bacterium]